MIRCIIVDDEELAHKVLEKYIESLPWMSLAEKFYNAIDTISYLRDNPVDLMFLDIRMPELSGLKMLNTLKNPPQVILTTAYAEYAIESYNYEVIDYLLKPIEFERFLIAVNRVSRNMEATLHSEANSNGEELKDNFIFVYQDHYTHRVDFRDILYIKSEGNYISIKTKSRNFITRNTMQETEKRLPGNLFIRIHKSYMVNRNNIKRVYGNTVVFDEGEIPIGKIYRRAFMEKLRNPSD